MNFIYRYVFGITHIPRLEDWPVMPVEHIGFMLMFENLQPHGFFNCSPAVDVPPSPNEADKECGAPKLMHNGLVAKL
ncbi:hypothetical protein GW17_00012656 [Ensete ventricosum]|uniref:Amine oxidase n=1 Tax=Ensete ventricosum TaxID=4639 RepID=A0A426Z121_ENSVE|nr:hypothetical protein B296_00024477 [Ensete ventricosum]RWW23110.1 hypothetical protein GW17_00012656 [Ensete ventricosum]RZR85076.1 hypothetical protein BHM03_00012028 [Ensete ventricosum]